MLCLLGSSYIQTKPVYPTSRGGATFIHTSHPNYSIGSHSSQFIQHPHTYEPQGPRPVPFNGGMFTSLGSVHFAHPYFQYYIGYIK